jgi:hypothetical protein
MQMSITAVDDDAEHTSQTLAKVGYACPPVHSQFKPGQSGNPSGRDDAGYRGGGGQKSGAFRSETGALPPRAISRNWQGGICQLRFIEVPMTSA